MNTPSDSACNLSVIFDSSLTISDHISPVSESCFLPDSSSDVNKDLRHKAKTKAKDTTGKAKAPNKVFFKAKAKDPTDKAKTKAKDTTRPRPKLREKKLCSKPMPRMNNYENKSYLEFS
jgi:hypothetical protein